MVPPQYPCEIWLQIFRLACVDDGTTGRSLSLVCRFFRDVSREAKLQSLAIFGVEEMIKFSTILETLPEQDRKVRHLFMSTETAAMRHEGGASQQGRFERTQPYELDRHRYELAVKVWRRLLTFLSTSLTTLYIFSIRLARSSLLAPVTLPFLVELHIAGPFPACYDIDPIPTFPTLRHLHFSGFHGCPVDVFSSVAQQAPQLMCLHLKPAQFSRNLCHDLQTIFHQKNKSSSSRTSGCGMSATVSMPSTFQKVFVYPGPEPSGLDAAGALDIHRYSIQKLGLLSNLQNSKLALADPHSLLTLDDALEQWEAIVQFHLSDNS
ncbi:hypothetical protein Moror_14072 [Moniliophthora roreri MCA 2997]|uniref:F-box domain-containing protein n=2 Tax=Moniliophthora roreri TaxID=221103 RepID=V2XQT3_MONRO|nr:hypothetical protein Moror_14072 [Moniliophthora roreri MCA 2997]KAI3619784.1 hypothetical protein WG66_002821 [Moniliophthora roreri]